MKYIMDMKDFCSKSPDSDEKNYNEQFYRYRIVNAQDELLALVWFTQMLDSGNIYTACVALKTELRDSFDIYVRNEDKDRGYYPKRFELSVSSQRINSDNYRKYTYDLAEAYSIACTVMEIFKDPEHTQHRKES